MRKLNTDMVFKVLFSYGSAFLDKKFCRGEVL